MSLLCRDKSKSASEQPPRHPPLPLQEAAESLSGKQASDDGRVVRGSSKPSKDGTGGRFYFNVTGFPFPLGPLFARQTVRTEVMVGKIIHALGTHASDYLRMWVCFCACFWPYMLAFSSFSGTQIDLA